MGAFEVVVASPVPGVTVWGMVALAVLMGTAVLVTRRQAAASRA